MLSSVTIHDVKDIALKDEKKISKTGQWVRNLVIKHGGGQTTISLFANTSGQLKVVKR